MTQLEQITVLRSLNDKMQAHSAGVLALFKRAGVDSTNPTLKELEIVKDMNPEIFEEVLRFLYPEQYRTANAEGFNWTSLVGGVLAGAGSGLLAMNGNDTALMQAQNDAILAEQKAQSQRTTMYVVLGVVAAIIVACVIIFKGKKR